MKIEFEDGTVELSQGEMYVVPKGVMHKPVAENECKIIFACNTEDFESVISKISQNNKVLIEKK